MQELFRSMRHRMNWTNATKILKVNGVSTSHGWDSTLSRLLESKAIPPIGSLQDALIEHMLCGQKFTKLYPIDANTRTAIEAAINSQIIDDCPATKKYPYLMDDADLELSNGDMKIVQVVKNDDGLGLVLSSVFLIKKREEISFQEFERPDEISKRFDEVVGIVSKPIQMFHVLWLPHHRDFFEIRVDAPKGIVETDIHGIHSILKSFSNKWINVSLTTPVNLFPAVLPFYEDDSEGVVVQMTFQTTTGGIKDEKLPKRIKNTDQRKEPYHVAGKDAVEAIAIYRIMVEWRFYVDKISFIPSVSLSASGPSGNGDEGNPIISGALIENCVRAADYEFVIERLGRKAQLKI